MGTDATEQRLSCGLSHCCFSINLQSPPCDAHPASSLPAALLSTRLFREQGKKKSISCIAASVQNCLNSSQSCQTQQHIHSRPTGLICGFNSVLHILIPSSVLSFRSFGHFAITQPTCLFCLLSSDSMAVLLSIICRTHISPDLCAEAETFSYIDVELRGRRCVAMPHL